MFHFHCLHFAIHPLIRFKFALNPLGNSVDLNNNVGKYNGRNEYDCKNENYHNTMNGVVRPDAFGMLGKRTPNSW